MINNNLTLDSSISIAAPPQEVWDALVNPEKIKVYLFGTNTTSEWRKGSQIAFTGVYEGTEYLDQGIILDIEPEKTLQYTYMSSFSGLEDLPENYSTLTFHLSEGEKETELKLQQVGFATKEQRDHSLQNWQAILGELKKLVEGQ